MSPLQLGLIVGGILLVVGVLVYNWWQERRVRRRIAETFGGARGGAANAPAVPAGSRVEPTLRSDAEATGTGAVPADAVPVYRPPADDAGAPPFEVPMDVVAPRPADDAPPTSEDAPFTAEGR